MADQEYRARNARIQLEGDELLFSKGGRAARVVAGPIDWRIPIACIREVVFKDAKLSIGLMHLVVGDAETPKASVWGLVDKPWTVEFQAGKQAKAMRELRLVLMERIAQNRSAGVDPSTARRPYVDPSGAEKLNEMKQKFLGEGLIRPPNPYASIEDIIALAKQHPSYSQSWSDLDSLEGRLRSGERLRLLTPGMVGLQPVLLGLTDHRVIVHANSATAKLRDEVPLPAHGSWKSSLLASVLTIRSGHYQVAVGTISNVTAEAFLEALE